jgi:hypothetical protein
MTLCSPFQAILPPSPPSRRLYLSTRLPSPHPWRPWSHSLKSQHLAQFYLHIILYTSIMAPFLSQLYSSSSIFTEFERQGESSRCAGSLRKPRCGCRIMLILLSRNAYVIMWARFLYLRLRLSRERQLFRWQILEFQMWQYINMTCPGMTIQIHFRLPILNVAAKKRFTLEHKLQLSRFDSSEVSIAIYNTNK